MAYAKRRDRNHAEIRDGLRKRNVAVLDLGSAGCGVSDLVAEHVITRRPVFLEVKDPKQPPSARKMTEDELTFASFVPVVVVLTLDDALDACGVSREVPCPRCHNTGGEWGGGFCFVCGGARVVKR